MRTRCLFSTIQVVFDVAEWERFVVGFDGDADPSVPLWESFGERLAAAAAAGEECSTTL